MRDVVCPNGHRVRLPSEAAGGAWPCPSLGCNAVIDTGSPHTDSNGVDAFVVTTVSPVMRGAADETDQSVNRLAVVSNIDDNALPDRTSAPSFSNDVWGWSVNLWNSANESFKQHVKWYTVIGLLVILPCSIFEPGIHTSWYWFLGIFLSAGWAENLERRWGIRYYPSIALPALYLLIFLVSHHPFGDIDVGFSVQRDVITVELTNVDKKPQTYSFENVDGVIRIVRLNGEFKDYPVYWTTWRPGETKSLAVALPFIEIERVEFRASNCGASGFWFDCDLNDYWRTVPTEAELRIREFQRRP